MLNLASQTFLIYGGGEDSLLDGGCHLQLSIYGDAGFGDLIMIFPSCHSLALISSCLLAKIVSWILLLIQLRPTLDGGAVSKLLGTNLDSFEANWILELDHCLGP